MCRLRHVICPLSDYPSGYSPLLTPEKRQPYDAAAVLFSAPALAFERGELLIWINEGHLRPIEPSTEVRVANEEAISAVSTNHELARQFIEDYLLTESGLHAVNDDKPLGAVTHLDEMRGWTRRHYLTN